MKLTESAEFFLKKTLGQDGLDALQKSEIFKIRANKVVDHHEIRTAMQVVPRTVLSFLQKELGSMEPGQNKTIKLPVDPEATLQVTKFDSDVYRGEILKNNKPISKFVDRTLPGVGLIIMSTFELYDISQLAFSAPLESPTFKETKVQEIIDERLGLRDLVRQIVDQKLTEREAIDNLIKIRLTQAISEASLQIPESKKEKSKKKLKEFIEKRSKKNPAEFKIRLEKSETVLCEDCKKEIFVSGAFSGCICYGDDRNNKIFVKKNENGFTIKFSKSWDTENIQMLLETLQKKNRG